MGVSEIQVTMIVFTNILELILWHVQHTFIDVRGLARCAAVLYCMGVEVVVQVPVPLVYYTRRGRSCGNEKREDFV